MWGPHLEFTSPTSFKITVLPDLFNKMRTFILMCGPHREFTCPTSIENIILHDLID